MFRFFPMSRRNQNPGKAPRMTLNSSETNTEQEIIKRKQTIIEEETISPKRIRLTARMSTGGRQPRRYIRDPNHKSSDDESSEDDNTSSSSSDEF